MNKLITLALLPASLIALLSTISVVAVAQDAMAPPPPLDYIYELSDVESGEYGLEHDHGRIHWTVDHHGFSMFTAVFPLVDATLNFDAQDVTKSTLEVVVDMKAVDSSIDAFNERLNGPTFFNTENYPTSVFKSTEIVMTGDNTLSVMGELTFLGETAPLTMDVNFIAAVAEPSRPPGGYRIGFNATAKMLRSEWGMPKGSVGDEVSLSIEAEFLRPEALEALH